MGQPAPQHAALPWSALPSLYLVPHGQTLVVEMYSVQVAAASRVVHGPEEPGLGLGVATFLYTTVLLSATG